MAQPLRFLQKKKTDFKITLITASNHCLLLQKEQNVKGGENEHKNNILIQSISNLHV